MLTLSLRVFAYMMFISTMHMHDRGFSKYSDVSTTLRLRKDMNSKTSQGKTLRTRVSHIRGFVLSGSTEQGCWQPPFVSFCWNKGVLHLAQSCFGVLASGSKYCSKFAHKESIAQRKVSFIRPHKTHKNLWL